MKNKGFTLVELLAVIAILAILVIVAMPNVLDMFNQAKINSFVTEVKKIMDTATTTFTKDALKNGGKTIYYSSVDNVTLETKQLDMTGNKKNYFIEMDRNGDFKRVVVYDANYCYDIYASDSNGKYDGSKSKLISDKITKTTVIVDDVWESGNDSVSVTIDGINYIVSGCDGAILANSNDALSPTCKLKATASGITFESKEDNVAVTEFGINESTSSDFNGSESVSLSKGTFYGHVKDEAGNTGICSITIGDTYVSSYEKITETCVKVESKFNVTTKTCNKSQPIKFRKYAATCLKSGSDYVFGGEILEDNNLSSCESIDIECNASNVGKIKTRCQELANYSFTSSPSSAATCTVGTYFECNSSTVGRSYVSLCTPAHVYNWEQSTETVASCYTNGRISCGSDNHVGGRFVSACNAKSYACNDSGFTIINNSYCYKY